MKKQLNLPSSCKILLFDLDGTLLDSFPIQHAAFKATFAHFGIEMSDERFYQVYTPHWFDVYRAMGLPEEVWEEADHFWLDFVGQQAPALFPGVPALLESLAERYVMGIVTSGSGDRVRRDLARTGITDRFAVLVTADDLTKPKPAPDGLRIALKALNASPEEAVYIGDTVTDCQMAHAAHVPFIGIRSGFSRGAPEQNCFHLDSVAELPGFLKRQLST